MSSIQIEILGPKQPNVWGPENYQKWKFPTGGNTSTECIGTVKGKCACKYTDLYAASDRLGKHAKPDTVSTTANECAYAAVSVWAPPFCRYTCLYMCVSFCCSSRLHCALFYSWEPTHCRPTYISTLKHSARVHVFALSTAIPGSIDNKIQYKKKKNVSKKYPHLFTSSILVNIVIFRHLTIYV
jgi:hypothetical protein